MASCTIFRNVSRPQSRPIHIRADRGIAMGSSLNISTYLDPRAILARAEDGVEWVRLVLHGHGVTRTVRGVCERAQCVQVGVCVCGGGGGGDFGTQRVSSLSLNPTWAQPNPSHPHHARPIDAFARPHVTPAHQDAPAILVDKFGALELKGDTVVARGFLFARDSHRACVRGALQPRIPVSEM